MLKFPLERYIASLNLWKEKVFLEVQVSRPKKYEPIDPEMSLDFFFEKKISELKKEEKVLEKLIEEAKQNLNTVPVQKQKSEVFWTTAVTDSEINKFILSIYGEVKIQYMMSPSVKIPAVSACVIPELLKVIDRGVEITWSKN